ncbi:MAG: UvrD-helicase domain-containing protein [Clostridia bacterium]|nr:UvrD-helicase domain-containing protein [Clostridia bacterium]
MSKEKNTNPEWTDAQKRAIYEDGNILVSASAGSGKTTVMIERVLRMIEKGIPLSRILVLVFNNSTAAELRQKITKELLGKISTASDAQRETYRRCLDELPFARISTLDGFCLSLVKEYFELLGISPNANIADDADLKAYFDIATKAMVEHFGQRDDELFDRLVSMFGKKRNEEGLLDVILKIHILKSIQPRGDEFLRKMEKSFTALEGGVFASTILENEKDVAQKLSNYALKLEGELRLDGQTAKADTIALVAGISGRIANCASLADLCSVYSSYESIGNLPRSPKGSNEELLEAAKAVKSKFTNVMKEGQSNFGDYDLLVRAHEQNAEFFLKIAESVKVFEDKLAEVMQKDEKFSFNDIELLAVKLLDSEQKDAIIAQFDCVFVDEYQDINPVQEFLINSFMNDGNTFMVGDTKQSIYGFRMADPKIFLSRVQQYQSGEGKNILLNRNFRSNDDILNFVNNIFDVIMTEGSCGVDYKANARFEFAQSKQIANADSCKFQSDLYKDNNLEKFFTKDSIKDLVEDKTNDLVQETTKDNELLHDSNQEDNISAEVMEEAVYSSGASNLYNSNIVVRLFTEPQRMKRNINGEVYKLIEHENYEEVEKAAVAEGRYIAEKIKAIVGKEQHLKAGRKYNFGDIAVLYRSGSSGVSKVIETLNASGIPLDNTSLKKSDAYAERELVNLLKVIDNPTADIDFAGFMLSFFGGFCEQDLAKIRIDCPSGSIYSACLKYAKYDNSLADRIKNKLQYLEQYRLKSAGKNVRELLESALYDSGYDAYLLAKGGEELAEVSALLSSLYGKDYNESVHKFLKVYPFVRSIKSNNIVASSNSKVAVKTIHTSKGLEFPIVFLINIDKPFSTNSIKGDLLVDVEGAVGMMYFNEAKRVKCKTISHLATKLAIRNRERREEMRLFYVALTRAQHKLYLTGTFHEDKNENSLAEPNSYLDFLREAVRQGNIENNSIYVVPSENLLVTQIEHCVPTFGEPKSEYFEEIKKQFEFEYAFKQSTVTAQKYSVTSIAKEASVQDDFAPLLFGDEVIEDEERTLGVNAKLKGIAYHKVLENIDFAQNNEDAVKEQISNLVKAGEMTAEMAELVLVNDILVCLNSDLGRLAARSICEREKPFMMLVPLCDISDREEDKYIVDKVLVQGVIDLLIYGETEGEQLVIVDFKNTSKSELEIRKLYKKQLYLYKMAVESALLRKVDKLILYSFGSGKTIIL